MMKVSTHANSHGLLGVLVYIMSLMPVSKDVSDGVESRRSRHWAQAMIARKHSLDAECLITLIIRLDEMKSLRINPCDSRIDNLATRDDGT